MREPEVVNFGLSSLCWLCSLLDRNLCDAVCVAAALELRSKELIHNLAGYIGIDEATGHYKHVGIVMLTYEVSGLSG